MRIRALGLCAFLLFANSVSFGEDDLLRKVLTAYEGAHRAHDSAQKACLLRSRWMKDGPPHEGETMAINWDAIEKQTRELMTKKEGAKPSEIINSVLLSLSAERGALFEDFVGCYPTQIPASEAVADALRSLNNLDAELGHELWHRVWATEKGFEYLKEHADQK